MFEVVQDFSDALKGFHKYKAGDAYEEQQEIWTKHLVSRGLIKKVEIEKKDKKRLFGNENVQEEQK